MTKAVGAAYRGRGHLAAGTPCQDATCAVSKRTIACIALADGAGSRRYSDHGARLAVEATTRFLQRDLGLLLTLADTHPDRVAELVLDVVLRAHRRHVRRKAYSIDDLACTLMFAAVKDGQLLAGHLGDGVIGLRDDTMRVLSIPDNGEYINSTVFVNDKLAVQRLRIYRQSIGIKAGVLLMSDGTAESLYDRAGGKLAPAAEKLLDWASKLRSKDLESVLVANLENVFSKKTHDDCALALLLTS